MKRNSIIKIFSIFLLFFLLYPNYVHALGNASTGFSGNSNVYVGNTIEITLYVGSVSGTTDDGGLAAFGGNLNYSSDKLELIGTQSQAPFNVELVGNKFGGFGANTIKGYSNIMKLTFRAKEVGTATVSYTGSSQPDSSASPVSISGCSKTINITNPPSTNNNLSSLTVSNGSLNFNKNNTSYTVNVDANITNINISASAEDGGASVTGTGNKSLNYGNNHFSIVVTAPSGDKKTYNINVIRKDNRSGNNRLASMTVNGGELKPGFSPNTESYNLSVPFSVNNLNIKANPEDNKAKVSIQNQDNLVAEETTTVKVVVTAENGSSRTYTIYVTRGKDPNKILSTNNYLSELSVSAGQLSPSFQKEQLKYVVYLPYEVDHIDITSSVEDSKYATIRKEGPEQLSVGANQYKLTVTAEDSSTREYIIVVYRGHNVLEQDLSSNNYLKEIKIKNGSLTSIFNKKQNIYYYTKIKDIKVSAIPEDENSKIEIIDHNGVYTILVEAATGDINIYTLIPKGTNIPVFLWIILDLILFVVGIFVGYQFHLRKTRNPDEVSKSKTKKKTKKIKKAKNKENIEKKL